MINFKFKNLTNYDHNDKLYRVLVIFNEII